MGAIKTLKEVEGALPKKNEVNYVRALDAQGNPILISKQDLAEVVGGLIGTPKGGYMRSLFESAGARFNDDSGFYELNGLTDITVEQMTAIYTDFNFNDEIFHRGFGVNPKNMNLIRTNIPPKTGSNNNTSWVLKQKWAYLGANIPSLEVVNIEKEGKLFLVADDYIGCTYLFYGCPKLREVKGIIDFTHCSHDLSYVCRACPALVTLKLKGLNRNWEIKDSPLLSKESILYVIENSTAKKAITITLHPDAYDMAMSDEDIKAALSEKTMVSLAK